MNMKLRFWFFPFILLILGACSQKEQNPRIIEDFNEHWQFLLGDDSLANRVDYDASQWRTLDLPHDWSIEGEFDKDNPGTTAEAALPTGIGWYRKNFTLPKSYKGKKVYIDFGGIFRDSKVWINGHLLGERPNGHVSFRYEMTSYLNFAGKPNVIAVRVDNSKQPNSRWYTGSGIYRDVRLIATNKIAVAHWGTYVTTNDVDSNQAQVNLKTSLSNGTNQSQKIVLETSIYDSSGNKVVSFPSREVTLTDSISEIEQSIQMKNPKLWSMNTPYQYMIKTSLVKDGEIVDSYHTPLGIRSFRFDEKKGFYLNGHPMKIRGVCLHEDLGALGVAINKSAFIRRLKLLKEMGCNAIRTAHNPPSTMLLDLCDQFGFLVMDEAFDVWEKKKVDYDYHIYWDKWHKKDLQDMVKRDRNHPSIFIWSIGNEIRAQFDSSGISKTKELVNIVKGLDTTRPVTAALTEMDPNKNFVYQSDALDILGFNYNHKLYSKLPDLFPNQKYIATETMSALETRGHYDMPSDSIMRWPESYDADFKGNPDYTVSAYDNVSAYWGSTHEETLKALKKAPYIAGLFVWSGFDYLGEPLPYPWPARSSYFGIIDLAGFPKDAFYLYQSLWTDKPVLHVFPHWNLPTGKAGGAKGQTVDVWAYYNNADEVELFLNGKSLGVRKKEGDDMHVMWSVKYEPGTLKAVSRKNGKTVLVKKIHTAGAPYKIQLIANRDQIKADGKDLSFITTRVLDKEGHLVPKANNLIQFSIEGPGKIVGTNNGYEADLESFQSEKHKAFNGLCLAVVQSKKKSGKIWLKARAKGLVTDSILIQSNK